MPCGPEEENLLLQEVDLLLTEKDIGLLEQYHCGPADTYRGAIRNTITYRLTGRSIQAKPLAAGESGLFEEKKAPAGMYKGSPDFLRGKKGPCGHVHRKSGLFEEKKAPAGMSSSKS